jgi:hypothetical protein
MTVRPVEVVILHPGTGRAPGPLERSVDAARRVLAERHRDGFLMAGGDRARIVTAPPDARPFGVRLRAVVHDLEADGLVILGSGAVPLATTADRRAFVDAAGGDRPAALTNNRYSADIVSVARARAVLEGLPDLRTDNALPRWLWEVARVPVHDLRRRWRLGVDIDGPLDLVLLGGRWSSHLPDGVAGVVGSRLAAVRAVADGPRAELVVAGRTSASTLAWLERHTQARTRALVEERGLRTSAAGQRPPWSVLGALLDRDGPGALAEHLARLGDAALIDARVLLAHRFGADDRAWPVAEDRYASDLLQPGRIGDPWLRELTASAATATVPIVLGGHTLVGPGLRIVVSRPR